MKKQIRSALQFRRFWIPIAAVLVIAIAAASTSYGILPLMVGIVILTGQMCLLLYQAACFVTNIRFTTDGIKIRVLWHSRELSTERPNRSKLPWVFSGLALMMALYGYSYYSRFHGPAADLGVSFDCLIKSGLPNVNALREKTEMAAESYLSQREVELTKALRGPYKVTVDYSLSSKMPSPGHHSIFRDYHWDIYLPYSLKPESGSPFILILRLTDAIGANKHDIDRFRVIGTTLLDDRRHFVNELENTPVRGEG